MLIIQSLVQLQLGLDQLSLTSMEFQLSVLFHVVSTVSMSTYCLKLHGLKRTNLTKYIHSPVPSGVK